MAYELPEQAGGLNLSVAPAGPPPPAAIPASVAPQVADVPDFGRVNLPGYTAEERTAALAPPQPNVLGRIGLAMEAFGAGAQGQEPLFLKLRRQQAVEDQLQTERRMKVQQYELEQQKRSDAIFQQGVSIAMDDGKPIETRIAALEGMSKQNSGIAALKPLITKQVLQDLPMAKDYLSPEVMKAIEGIQRNPNGKVDFPGGLTGIAAEIKNSAEFGRSVVKQKGEAVHEKRLMERYANGGQLEDADKKFLVDRKRERDKLDLEFAALGLQNRKLEADTKVAEQTVTSRIGEAARPKTLEVQVDNKMVTLQETAPGSGKWETLIVGGKLVQGDKKPLVENTVNVSTEKKYGEIFAGKIAEADDKMRESALKAPDLAERANRTLQVLRSGKVITGFGADYRLQFAKAMQLAGLSTTGEAKDTEILSVDLAANTLDAIKASGLGGGTGFSNADRDFLEKAKGGKITLERDTLTRLAELAHRAAQLSTERWNTRVKQIPDSALTGTGITRDPITVPPLIEKLKKPDINAKFKQLGALVK